MKTYVEIYHSLEGAKVSEIFELMKSLWFEPALGEHEFVYKSKKKRNFPQSYTFSG